MHAGEEGKKTGNNNDRRVLALSAGLLILSAGPEKGPNTTLPLLQNVTIHQDFNLAPQAGCRSIENL